LGSIGLAVVLLTPVASASVRAAPTTASLAPHLGTPYRNVPWTALSYPGLHCAYISQGGNVAAPGAIVVVRLAEVRVAGRAAPLAIAVVSCNENHYYANFFAFRPGANPKRPVLLQRLGLFQGTKQLAALATSPGRVKATLAGYTSSEPQCCPGVIVDNLWVWNGDRFVAQPPRSITSITMPNLVGLRLPGASAVLGNLGIVFYDFNGGPTANSAVIATQSPPAGTILRPPTFQVSITTR
jgi:hypothetical protein